MAARTEKQREQWKRFNKLGQLTSLAAWIGPKVSEILKDRTMPELDRAFMQHHADNLVSCLIREAKRNGWKPKE